MTTSAANSMDEIAPLDKQQMTLWLSSTLATPCGTRTFTARKGRGGGGVPRLDSSMRIVLAAQT
jgi:hypothetical protein